jgi:hypothetical protein
MAVAGHPIGNIINGRLVTAHQFAKRFYIASLGVYNQVSLVGYRHRYVIIQFSAEKVAISKKVTVTLSNAGLVAATILK